MHTKARGNVKPGVYQFLMCRLQHAHTGTKSHYSWGRVEWGLGHRAGWRKKSGGQTEGRDPGGISQDQLSSCCPVLAREPEKIEDSKCGLGLPGHHEVIKNTTPFIMSMFYNCVMCCA